MQCLCCTSPRNGKTGKAPWGKCSVFSGDVQGWRVSGGPSACLLHTLGWLGGRHSKTLGVLISAHRQERDKLPSSSRNVYCPHPIQEQRSWVRPIHNFIWDRVASAEASWEARTYEAALHWGEVLSAALAITLFFPSLGLWFSCWAEKVFCLWYFFHWSWWGNKLLWNPSMLKTVPWLFCMFAVRGGKSCCLIYRVVITSFTSTPSFLSES